MDPESLVFIIVPALLHGLICLVPMYILAKIVQIACKLKPSALTSFIFGALYFIAFVGGGVILTAVRSYGGSFSFSAYHALTLTILYAVGLGIYVFFRIMKAATSVLLGIPPVEKI